MGIKRRAINYGAKQRIVVNFNTERLQPNHILVTLVPEVFLDFSSGKRSRASREAATTSRESDEERERKTSGYLGLESHFHADDSCQTRQIANKKSEQWQFSKHVLISRYFFKWG